MFKKIIFILALFNLASCVERDVYKVNRPAIVEQVQVLPAREVIAEPEIFVPEKVAFRRNPRIVERIVVRP